MAKVDKANREIKALRPIEASKAAGRQASNEVGRQASSEAGKDNPVNGSGANAEEWEMARGQVEICLPWNAMSWS